MSKNNLIKKISTCFLLLASLCAFSQQKVTGTVTGGDSKDLLPEVNVQIKGTSQGTVTDFDGNYSITLSNSDVVLVFSYLGYTTKEVKVNNQKTINVNLVEDSSSLDEIVVVGYGTRKKSHLTGAIAKIGGGDIAAVQAARVDDALAGKLSGVLIQNQTGEPGADPKIQIRAASSVSGASNPLIVVDGYPISGSLATINPNDVESMEILKDAASAAIYGSRGANGVILVTTKKGKSGKAKFSYDTYMSVSSKYRDNILMSGPEWAAHARTQLAAGNWAATADNDAAFNEYRLSAYENSPGAISPEDWLFRNGSSTSHNFSYSGGSDDVNYFASLGYQNTEGVVITQGFERLNARLNIDAKLGDKFKTGLSFNGFTSDRDIVAHDMRDLLRAYGVHSIYHTAESIAFVQDLNAQSIALGFNGFDSGYRGGLGPQSINDLVPGDRADDWHYGRNNDGIGGSGDAGPAQKLDNADQWQKTFFANVNTYLQYEIIEGLNIKTVLGGDFRDTQDYYWQGVGADSRARTNQSDLDQTDLKTTSVLSETTLQYATVINDVHDISAVVGVEFQQNTFKGTSLNGTNLTDSPIINYNLLAPADIVVSERKETRTRNSVFGRVNYAYDDRYLVSASLRRDGDSRFGVNKRYEVFPAVSLGWNVHKESFLADNDVVSNLKVRVSTGSLGTTSFLGSYNSLSLLNPGATVYGNGFLIPSNVANPDLTWQTNTETNYGIDFGILNNRFTLGIDYYTSDVEDMLINQSVSEVLGTTSIILNTGDVRSSGLELEFAGSIISNDEFSWNLSGNFSTVKTEITDLGGLEQLPNYIFGQSGRGAVFRNYVGGEIGEMWGLETIGEVEMTYLADGTRHPNSQTGESYVVDQNGDGVIDRSRTVAEGGDLVKIGQNTPDFYWGLNSSFSYKDFDMSFQLQGAQGGEVYNIDPLYYGSQWGGRLDYSLLDADGDGRADHNGEFYERNRNQTDALIQDASYIALRNLTIGYTVDTKSTFIESLRVYGAATNLLYLMGDDYTSYNPEGVETTGGSYQGPTSYGAQVGASPVVRSFTLGLNINF